MFNFQLIPLNRITYLFVNIVLIWWESQFETFHLSTLQAATPDDAEQGMLFMQEMIELSKTQSNEGKDIHMTIM